MGIGELWSAAIIQVSECSLREAGKGQQNHKCEENKEDSGSNWRRKGSAVGQQKTHRIHQSESSKDTLEDYEHIQQMCKDSLNHKASQNEFL